MSCLHAPPAQPSRISTAIRLAALALTVSASAARTQQPDTSRRDSTMRRSAADSARIADSIAVVRELERLRNEPRANAPAAPATQGPTNPRLLPDISAVGDLIGDLSPKGSTQEGGERFSVREVEIALQAAVDPYFRGDIFLGLSDLEKISIEQAYITATSLPWGLEVRLGRYLMPVSKQNTTHRHDLHTIEYPYVLQRFLGEEGLKGTGISASRIFAPLGFYQELILAAVDRFGEAPEGRRTIEPVNKQLSGLGYSARLRNYWDLDQASNVELSFSGITGMREQPVTGGDPALATRARQSVIGADATYRWRPLQRGLYRSFIVQTEVMQQRNQRDPTIELPDGVSPSGLLYGGPTRDFAGGYVFARYQLTRRGYVSARLDAFQDEAAAGKSTTAGSAYLELFPSEFSKLMAGYERYSPAAGSPTNRLLLQATFALGPHKPHPF